MAVLERVIEEFVKVEKDYRYGYGRGYGNGSGYGSGYGCGDGSGYGTGYGRGYGSGDGSGYGRGYGRGYGCGTGYGSGYGTGYGRGYGSGCGYGSDNGTGYGCGTGSSNSIGSGYGFSSSKNLKTFCGNKICMIDGIPTIIKHISKNIAKGFILQDDFTLKPCYIAKGHNLFAHGETIEEAVRDLQEKILSKLDTDEAIEEFKKKFNNTERYDGTEFYKWHNYLTGSCAMGRSNFVAKHNIDLNAKYTVKEFIELCKNDYGGEIIKRLEEFYK